MSNPFTTGSAPKLLVEGLMTVWGANYNEYDKEYSAIFETVSSEKNYEEDLMIPGFTLAPAKPEGSSTSYTGTQQGYIKRYTPIPYGLGFVITYEAIKDNLYKQASMNNTKKLARSFRQTKETVCANIINRGFNSSYTGGDAVELFSASHPTLAGNQSNIIGTAADLSEAAIEDLVNQMAQAKDSAGLVQKLLPRSLHIHAAEQFNAERIVKSVNQNDSANNAINAIRSMGVFPDGVKVNHFFTDLDAWFIKTDADNGFKLIQREDPMFAQDQDFDTSNWKFKGYERYAAGWTDWRCAYGSAGA